MARNRRRIAGLTAALEEYFTGQLDKQREFDGKFCPGEDECADPESSERGPLSRYPHETIEYVCGGCSLRTTKPGNSPAHLVCAINSTIEIADLPENATFAYPDALDIWGWAGLRALSRARNSDLKKSSKQKPKDAAPQGQMMTRKPGEKAAVQTFDWSRITATPND